MGSMSIKPLYEIAGFEDAYAYLIGYGSVITKSNFYKLVDHARGKNKTTPVDIINRACTLACIALDVHPMGFVFPITTPTFDIGDYIIGGRIVFDEYVNIGGVVYKIEPSLMDNVGTLVTIDTTAGPELILGSTVFYVVRRKVPKLPLGAVGWCHYCGAPAYKIGFFGEPVCNECR